MNVLHITNKPIFPTLDGGRLAMHKLLLNLLDKGYHVKNLTIATNKHPFLPDTFPEKLKSIIQPEAVHINTDIKLFDVIVSWFKRESYQVKRFYSREFEQKIIDELNAVDYDVVIIESAFLLSYLSAMRHHTAAKIIVRTHNVEYRIWRQAVKKERSIIKRMYYRKLANTMKRFELKFLNMVDGVMCISAQDRDFFKRRGIRVPMTVIPVHMEVENRHEVDYSCNDFYFIGSMNWKPNIDAVNWIIKRLAPQVFKILPEAKIHLAGSNMPKSMQELKSKNIVVHGRVPDMREFMSKHGTLIVPLKSGSGVRIKILEALSVGVPIISTDKGKEGIGVQPKLHYLSANVSEEFLTQIKLVYDNPERRKLLGVNGKKFIEDEYGLHHVSEKISEFIRNIS